MIKDDRIPKPLEGEDWHIIDDVPLFVEHDLVERRGNKVRRNKFDRRRIEKLCANVEKSCQAGRFPIIQADHLPDDIDSTKINQFGFTCNHRTKIIDGKAWIFGTELVYKNKVKEREAYPYRSIELPPGEDIFCPVALLKHTPRLDIGVTLPIDVRQGKVPAQRIGKTTYSLPRRLSVRVGQAGNLVYSLHGGSTMAADAVSFDPKALQSALDGLNTALKPLVEGKVSFSARDAEPLEVISPEDELAQLKKRLEDLEKSSGTTITYSRRRTLDELAKDYELDVETEMKEYGDVSDAEFTKHTGTIKRAYSRRSTGGGARVDPLAIAMGDPTFGGRVNADHVQRATLIAPLIRDKTGQAVNIMHLAREVAEGKHKEL